VKLALAIVIAFAGLARADEPASSQAGDLYAEGQRLYGAGDYAAAAQKFQAAWAAERDPVFLYNAAQAFRLGKRCGDAGAYYRQFLAQVANPPNLAEVKAYLVEVDACAKAQQPAPVVADDPGRGKRRLGLVLAAGGAIGVALGVVSTYRVHSLEKQHDELCDTMGGSTCAWTSAQVDREQRLHDLGTRAEIGEAIGYGLGGATLVTGVVLYMMGREPSTEHAVTVVPSRGGATVTASFAF
jgi:hypothetical protein